MQRLLRKSQRAIYNYGFIEFLKRLFVFFDRKIRRDKYFHFQISKINEENRILFISGEPKNATSYYRCEIPRSELELNNWYADIVYEDFTDKIQVEKYKAIVFYRTPLADKNQRVLDSAQQNKIPVIFSIDDLVYRRDLVENLEYTKNLDEADADRLLIRADGMIDLMKKCDAGIASTEYLAQDMRKYIDGPVLVSRNSYKENYDFISGTKNDEVVILGYFSGSETHDRDFELIWPAITSILDTNSKVVLWVGGRINYDFGKYKNRITRLPFMSREDYMKKLSQVDINLFPLEDNEFNRGKSEIKYTEAALVHVPTVASPTGDIGKIIQDGENGILAANLQEWEKKLNILIADQQLRIGIGGKAKKFVIDQYNPQKLGKELIEFLSRV